MSPYPLEEARALGPMRLVLTTYPTEADARAAVEAVLDRRLAACANFWPTGSRYWWKGSLESASEVLVVYKTVPKRVGALFAFVKASHPYDVPEVLEVDVPRVEPGYLRYLGRTLDPAGSSSRRTGPVRRPGGPRGRGARAPARTRARHRPRSRRTGTLPRRRGR